MLVMEDDVKAYFFPICDSSNAKICSECGANISRIVFIEMSFWVWGPLRVYTLPFPPYRGGFSICQLNWAPFFEFQQECCRYKDKRQKAIGTAIIPCAKINYCPLCYLLNRFFKSPAIPSIFKARPFVTVTSFPLLRLPARWYIGPSMSIGYSDRDSIPLARDWFESFGWRWNDLPEPLRDLPNHNMFNTFCANRGIGNHFPTEMPRRSTKKVTALALKYLYLLNVFPRIEKRRQ